MWVRQARNIARARAPPVTYFISLCIAHSMATQHLCLFLKGRGRQRSESLSPHRSAEPWGSKATFEKQYGAGTFEKYYGQKAFNKNYGPNPFAAPPRPSTPPSASKNSASQVSPSNSRAHVAPNKTQDLQHALLRFAIQQALNRHAQEQVYRYAQAAQPQRASSSAHYQPKRPAPSGPKEWWQTLGVSPNASSDTIKAAYRTMAKTTHPDTAANGSAEKFHAVHQAYKQGMEKK